MSAMLESARAPRPLEFWNERYSPGYLAQLTAAEADPLALATEIERQAVEFAAWLHLPAELRWDSYRLQAFGAALFNRYRTGEPSANPSAAALERELVDLAWPEGSEEIRATLASLQNLLRAPLAVYKMLSIAANAADYPTPQELELAMAALQNSLDALTALTERLQAARADYAHRICELAAKDALNHPLVGRSMAAAYPAACSRSA